MPAVICRAAPAESRVRRHCLCSARTTEMTRLTLNLFGGLRVRFGERDLTFPTRKAHALLAYLAVRPEEKHTRNKLAAMFWGGAGKEQARQSLRQSLSTLRSAFARFDPRILVIEGDRVTLGRSSIDVDVAEFERLAARSALRDLEQAGALDVGDLLVERRLFDHLFGL